MDTTATPTDGLAWAIAAFRDDAQAERYRTYLRYYHGDQDLAFATPKYETAFGRLFEAFAYNRCASVVDAHADRLQVVGFDVEDGDDAIGAAAWELWRANRMDQRSGEVHQEAPLAGDAYVIVWPEAQPDGSERVCLWPNEAGKVRVRYDDEHPERVAAAAKSWRRPDGFVRLTMYFPDRVEKYISRSKASAMPSKPEGFVPYELPGEPWPVPNPWDQVPVFHFGNNARTGRYGRSELADVIPLQDALNKSTADMMVAMEFAAFAQRWATGITIAIDPETGKPIQPWDPGVDKIIAVADAAAKFGQFEAANLPQFLNVQDGFDLKIARVSKVPAHYLGMTGAFPSGEALKTAEAPFVKKIKDRQRAFGNVWEDVMRLALRMSGLADPPRLSTLWESAEPRSDLESVNLALLKKQVGLSQQQILKELGYADEEIEQIIEEKQNAAAEYAQAFNQGALAAEDANPAES